MNQQKTWSCWSLWLFSHIYRSRYFTFGNIWSSTLTTFFFCSGHKIDCSFVFSFLQHQGLNFCNAAVAAAESHDGAGRGEEEEEEQSVQWKMCTKHRPITWQQRERTYLCCAAALCAALCRTSSGRRLPAPTRILLEVQTRPRSLGLRTKGKMIENYIFDFSQK